MGSHHISSVSTSHQRENQKLFRILRMHVPAELEYLSTLLLKRPFMPWGT